MRFINSLLSKWNAKHLVAAWCVYWVGLVLWGVGSLLPVIWRMSRPDAHGNATASFDGGAFHLTVLEGTTTIWNGGIAFQTLAFLIAVPPLALWAWWLFAQRRPPSVSPDLIDDGSPLERGVPSSDIVGVLRRKESDD